MRILNRKLFPEVLFIVGVFLFFLIKTFHIGPDPLVDSGREVYVPLALLDGKTLYRDILYFNGPVSPYLNALIYRIVPFTIQNWKIINTFFLALITSAIWLLIYLRSGRLNACLATLFFVVVFGLQVLPYGLMNDYLTPYSHEMVHAFLVCLIQFILFHFYLKTSDKKLSAGIGFLTGILFLMKPEFFLASLSLPAILLFTTQVSRFLFSYILGFSIPLIITFSYFLLKTDLITAGHALVSPWTYILFSDVTQNHFYKQTLGTSSLSENLKIGLRSLAVFLMTAGLIWTSCRLKLRQMIFLPWSLAIFTLLAFSAAFIFFEFYVDLSLGLPYLLIILLFWIIIREKRNSFQFNCAFALFSILLLLKIFFRSTVYGYGFALTVPAILCLYLRNYRSEAIIKSSFVYLSGFIIVFYGLWSLKVSERLATPASYKEHYFTVAGVFTKFPEVLRLVEETVPPEKTLLAFPEGLLVNVLTNREHPVKSTNFMPPEFDMFSEEIILRDIVDSAPDYILLVDNHDRPSFIYNKNFFKKEYAGRTFDWIFSKYQKIWEVKDQSSDYTLMLKK